MKTQYTCEKCGEKIDYENYVWEDNANIKHIVCIECNEELEEDYTESDYPDAKLFSF